MWVISMQSNPKMECIIPTNWLWQIEWHISIGNHFHRYDGNAFDFKMIKYICAVFVFIFANSWMYVDFMLIPFFLYVWLLIATMKWFWFDSFAHGNITTNMNAIDHTYKVEFMSLLCFHSNITELLWNWTLPNTMRYFTMKKKKWFEQEKLSSIQPRQ